MPETDPTIQLPEDAPVAVCPSSPEAPSEPEGITDGTEDK